MGIISTTRRILRGDVTARTAALEATRRVRAMKARRSEQAQLAEFDRRPPRFRKEFEQVHGSELLAYFHSRAQPKSFPGLQSPTRTSQLQQQSFPDQTKQLVMEAQRIVNEHRWELLGFGEQCYGEDEIQWNRDPLSGFDWPLDYHADIELVRHDGSDARVVWELNRCAHFITLARAYAITGDDRISSEFFRQLKSWRDQNPVARGVNWNCAMEVALRAMNLLGAFGLFLRAPQMNEVVLKDFLRIFDQHGAHIQRNLEFSHIATSNHYLADVAGLLWIGLMLPELEAANDWRDFGLSEMLREMEKQTLPDGADYEASTGYHRLKAELFLYSFVLCELNGFDIQEKYWATLRAMFDYMCAYARPDGSAPLIGDSDSGQIFPIVRRRGDDLAYLLALGATVFHEPRFKPASGDPFEELLWISGEQGVHDYQQLTATQDSGSKAFPDAGVYLLRDADLYLHFNAGGIGVNGRGSHGHNDALSLEVSAYGSAFVVDPGSYLYTADLSQRHLFRSTAYHSTVEVDGVEQNTIEKLAPFIIGNDARPRVLEWETTAERDVIIAEHNGYQRLAHPVIHRRAVRFEKEQLIWLVEDELTGEGIHEFSFRFHFAPGLETKIRPEGIVEVCDNINGVRLLILCQKLDREGGHGEFKLPLLESRFSSRDYGHKEPSISVCWNLQTAVPLKMKFLLVPVRIDENENERLNVSVPGATAT
ncbi:MAG TPA: alginate lyase family protein [Pyrinomonadaceae bacterium]|nr:alginate lyase family protein [Pyrinomonadaceae bacterium]